MRVGILANRRSVDCLLLLMNRFNSIQYWVESLLDIDVSLSSTLQIDYLCSYFAQFWSEMAARFFG